MKRKNEQSTQCPVFRAAQDTSFIQRCHERCDCTRCTHFTILRLTSVVPVPNDNLIVQHSMVFLRACELFHCFLVPKWLLSLSSLGSNELGYCSHSLPLPFRGDISTFLRSVRGPPSKTVQGAGGLTGSPVLMVGCGEWMSCLAALHPSYQCFSFFISKFGIMSAMIPILKVQNNALLKVYFWIMKYMHPEIFLQP